MGKKLIRCFFLVTIIMVVFTAQAHAKVADNSENILVTTGQFFGSILPSQFYEFTQDGIHVKSGSVPYGTAARPTSEIVRDIVVGKDGSYYIYNGTFTPYLSVYDPKTDVWQHFRFDGWSTVNNVSYGGIAIDKHSVYVTDMYTAYDGVPSGLVRFDTKTFSAERCNSGTSYIDVTRGLDGNLYALRNYGMTVDVFSLKTVCQKIDTTYLGHEVRGIAVDEIGEIFGADWNGYVYHFGLDGTIINSIYSGGSNLTDIDVSLDGTLVVGERFGKVILTDKALNDPTTIVDIGDVSTFVTFVSARVKGKSR